MDTPNEAAPQPAQEPVHFRAVLDAEQVPQQLKTSMHVVGFRTWKAADEFVASERDMKGWRYTIEPLCICQHGIRYKLPPLELNAAQVAQFAAMAREGARDAVWQIKELPPISAMDADGPCPGGIAVMTDGQPGWAFLTAAPQPAQEPVAWKHDCAALLQNDVELWVDRCPHCGKPRTTPQAPQPARESLLVAIRAEPTEMIYKGRVMELVKEYTTPQAPQRQPLTDEQIEKLRLETGYAAGAFRFAEIVRAVEAAQASRKAQKHENRTP